MISVSVESEDIDPIRLPTRCVLDNECKAGVVEVARLRVVWYGKCTSTSPVLLLFSEMCRTVAWFTIRGQGKELEAPEVFGFLIRESPEDRNSGLLKLTLKYNSEYVEREPEWRLECCRPVSPSVQERRCSGKRTHCLGWGPAMCCRLAALGFRCDR